uniref:Craniofacial development protein 2 n=1 Tax=Cacopsylla melanoneura TaxID=428564 RepID=A0A8D8X0K2_9HEMI
MPRNKNGMLNWLRTRNLLTDLNSGQRIKRDAKDLKLATWNVRTLLQAGKMQEVANEMIKYKLDVIALQEIRWQGQGKIDKKEYSLIYSGPEKRNGQLGTGFIVNKTVRDSIMEYCNVNDRICKIRLKGNFRNISIISVHAPTEEKSEEEKETFYDELDRTVSQVPKYDITLIMGDFNAQIGNKENQEEVAGRYSLHEYNNDNGDYLTEFAARTKLYIRSTSFPHKRIHLGTWKIPGKNEFNQIDHVLISKRHYSSITNVRAYRGPNIDSDHYLVKVVLRERLSVIQNMKRTRQMKWNTCKLKTDENMLNLYQEALRRKMEDSENTTRNKAIEEKWEITKDAILEAARETVGEKDRERNRSWFDQECRDIIEKKNQARRAMLSRNTRHNSSVYKTIRKQSKAILKKKKKDSMVAEIKRIEDLNNEGEDRKFYSAMKRIRKDFQPRTQGCRNSNGAIETDEKKVIERWMNYFKTLLNKDYPEENEADNRLNISTSINQSEEDAPSTQEVCDAIKKMRNNRAPGEDGIVAELIKYGGFAVESAIHKIIKEVWMKEIMPESWNVGVICPIHKKGDKSNCENYRGITLLDTTYKILTTIINNRIKEVINDKIGEYQCGFRPARGTTDQLFVVRQIFEKCYEYDIDLNILFIDFKQAFDSLERSKLKDAMKSLEIPSKLINLAMMSMAKSKAKVKIDNILSDPLEINAGVKQGDSLSATLFIIALHKAVEEIDQRGTIFIKSTQICAYADDIALISRSEHRLIEIYKELEEKGKTLGLVINEAKTKYMKLSAAEERRQIEDLVIDDKTFQGVGQFKYLGEIVSNNGKTSSAIKERLQLGNRAYFANQILLKNKLLTRKTKMTIYRTIIRPVITYGSESWTLTKEDQEKIRRFERKVIRRIYGPIRVDEDNWRIRYNSEINDILNGEDIVKFIKSQRLRWFGHLQRMEETRMPKKIINAKIYSKRKKGRPRLRWIDDVTKDLQIMGVRGWMNAANNRVEWRCIVEEAKAHPEL